jgi:hypothetical protein
MHSDQKINKAKTFYSLLRIGIAELYHDMTGYQME